MKSKKLALVLLSFVSVHQSASALSLNVVKDYALAAQESVWNKAKADAIPSALLTTVEAASPAYAYSHLFPKTFMQEELFAVCHRDCNQQEILRLNGNEITNTSDSNVIEQMNVYYWMRNYFGYLESHLNFRPKKFLKVMTDRIVQNETGSIQRNNAFFNPADFTLTFLPASKSFFFKLFNGKINRSGFDPSVIAHESSHYLFEQLYPVHVNDEITGLNEGFADYVANTLLENPKVGLVMLQGKVLRDSSSPISSDKKMKTYLPKLEAHDLGERVAYALWKLRELAPDKAAIDRMVIDAVVSLRSNPYSTVHDFKKSVRERLPTVLDASSLSTGESILNIVFQGESRKIDNLDFMNESVDLKLRIGYKTKLVLPQEMAQQMGQAAVKEQGFAIVKALKLSETQVATLVVDETNREGNPYWIVVDKERQNVLGIYDQDKRLVTDARDIKRLEGLSEKVGGGADFTTEFFKTIKEFADLKEGKGPLSLSYKIKKQTVSDENITFNDENRKGHKIELKLKRKFLGGVLLGATPIETLTLFTLDEPSLNFPAVSEEKIIGYKITLEGGVSVETTLSEFPL